MATMRVCEIAHRGFDSRRLQPPSSTEEGGDRRSDAALANYSVARYNNCIADPRCGQEPALWSRFCFSIYQTRGRITPLLLCGMGSSKSALTGSRNCGSAECLMTSLSLSSRLPVASHTVTERALGSTRKTTSVPAARYTRIFSSISDRRSLGDFTSTTASGATRGSSVCCIAVYGNRWYERNDTLGTRGRRTSPGGRTRKHHSTAANPAPADRAHELNAARKLPCAIECPRPALAFCSARPLTHSNAGFPSGTLILSICDPRELYHRRPGVSQSPRPPLRAPQ